MNKCFQRLKALNEALPGMLVGIVAYLVIGELIILILLPYKFFIAIGFFAGCVYSAFAIIHMSYVLEQVSYMSGDGHGATGKTVLGYGLRLLIMAIIFAGLYFLLGNEVVTLLAAFAGIFSMKVAAYIWPITNKLATKYIKKGR